MAAERIAALLAGGLRRDLREVPSAVQVTAKAPPRKPEPPSRARPVALQPAWMNELVPPLDKQLATLKKKLARAGLGHRSAEIEALARPGIALSVKKAKLADLKAVVSRIGGDPDLPATMKWPSVKGQPLAFVAQIVLADMKAHDLERVLPASGVLSFFAQLDSARDDYGELAFVAHLPSESQLGRTPAPEGVARIATAGLLTPRVRLTLPQHEEPAMAGLRLSSDEASAYHDQVFLGSIPEGRVHVLGGWASAATQHGIKGRRFCAQFDSDHHIALEMGDCETLRFYLKGDAFVEAALNGAVCTLSES
nr:DUF1963 domain-containing protein [Deltaproteobacteria bacterium]